MQHGSSNDSSWPLFAGLARTVAQLDDEQIVWAHADDVFRSVIGHQLFTVLRYDAANGNVTRLYSNRPSEYPVSGTKHKGPTPWGEQVLKQGRYYLGRNAADIEWAFEDHALIASMGLESVLNLPIRVANTTLGTVNLLHVADYYDESHLDVGTILATLLAPVFMHLQTAAP